MHEVDVIIPLYNGADWIKETIKSVSDQHVAASCIVVDDGSIDGSPEIVRQMPDILLLSNPDKGVSSARNFGLKHCAAPFVAFLDQDDVWHPQHLRILLEPLKLYRQVPVAISGYRSFLDGTRPQFDLSDSSIRLYSPWDLYPFNVHNSYTCTMLFRREVLADHPWVKSHEGEGDFSLFMRVSEGCPVIRSNAKTLAYRKQYQSTLLGAIQDGRGYMKHWEKVTDDLLQYHSLKGNSSDKHEILQRRNLVAHTMYHLIENLLRGDQRGIVELAWAFERLIEKENFSYWMVAFTELAKYIFVVFMVSEDVIEQYSTLLEIWPQEAARSYKFIQRTMSRAIVKERPGFMFYLNYGIMKPLARHRLGVLEEAILGKFVGEGRT